MKGVLYNNLFALLNSFNVILKCVLFEKSPKNLNFLTFFSGGKFKLQKNERTYKIFDDFSNKMHFSKTMLENVKY